jgi:hypothetical protein
MGGGKIAPAGLAKPALKAYIRRYILPFSAFLFPPFRKGIPFMTTSTFWDKATRFVKRTVLVGYLTLTLGGLFYLTSSRQLR